MLSSEQTYESLEYFDQTLPFGFTQASFMELFWQSQVQVFLDGAPKWVNSPRSIVLERKSSLWSEALGRA